jgi:hypothetical protein
VWERCCHAKRLYELQVLSLKLLLLQFLDRTGTYAECCDDDNNSDSDRNSIESNSVLESKNDSGNNVDDSGNMITTARQKWSDNAKAKRALVGPFIEQLTRNLAGKTSYSLERCVCQLVSVKHLKVTPLTCCDVMCLAAKVTSSAVRWRVNSF